LESDGVGVKAQIVPEHLHTALRVRDLEGALRFYTEVIGLAVSRTGGPPERPNSVWLEGVQLVRAADQDTAEKGVLDHIGFSVANIEAIVESVTAAGTTLEAPIRETALPNGQTMKLVFFRDPEGNRIELTQR
jgi:catechol 2,3-dioxygenase-like lactoylglutathione lyase family enzyme